MPLRRERVADVGERWAACRTLAVGRVEEPIEFRHNCMGSLGSTRHGSARAALPLVTCGTNFSTRTLSGMTPSSSRGMTGPVVSRAFRESRPPPAAHDGRSARVPNGLQPFRRSWTGMAPLPPASSLAVTRRRLARPESQEPHGSRQGGQSAADRGQTMAEGTSRYAGCAVRDHGRASGQRECVFTAINRDTGLWNTRGLCCDQ